MNRLKTKLVAKAFIENEYSATKALKAIEPNLSPEYAPVKASRMLKNDKFIEAVHEELDSRGLTNEKIDGELYYILNQKKHLPSKLGAIIEVNKLKRRYPKEESGDKHLHIHLPPDQRKKRIEDIQGELQRIHELRGE